MSLKKYITEAAVAINQPVVGDSIQFVVNGIKTINATVVEHDEKTVVININESDLNELSSCGITLEAEPMVAQNDEEEEVEYFPQVGDIVKIDYPTEHEGEMGEVVQVAPSGTFAYVHFGNGDEESYHSSDLIKVSDEEAEQYLGRDDDEFYDDDDEDEGYAESLNRIRNLSGIKEADTPQYDQSPDGPYDRGAADAYYGRRGRPHKIIDKPNATVKGERMHVELTDPKEIEAYYAGYNSAEFGEKDYGTFPDYGNDDDDLDEEVNIAEAQMGSYLGVSALRAPPTKQYRPAMWENMLGTVYAMDDNGKVDYFDYKHKDAIAFSGANEPGADPRLYRINRQAYGKPYGEYRYGGNDDYASPTHGKLVLWIKKKEYRKAPEADPALNEMRRLAGMKLDELSPATIRSYGRRAMGQIDDIEDREVAGRQRPDDLKTLKKRDKGLTMAAKKVDEISEPVLNRYLAARTRQGASNKLDHVTRALGKVNAKWGWRGDDVKVPAGKDMRPKDTWDDLPETALGGDKYKRKENPNNAKSDKSSDEIHKAMNDSYGKVADAKGHERKRLLQRGHAAFKVGMAQKNESVEIFVNVVPNKTVNESNSRNWTCNVYTKKA